MKRTIKSATTQARHAEIINTYRELSAKLDPYPDETMPRRLYSDSRIYSIIARNKNIAKGTVRNIVRNEIPKTSASQ